MNKSPNASPLLEEVNPVRASTVNPSINIRPKQQDDKSDEEIKRPRWITRAMAEEISREAVLLTTLKESVIYLIFLIVVTISTVGRRSSSMFYLTQALKGQFLEREFQTDNDVGITYEDIKTASDFWHYAETLMVDSFYWESYYNPYDPVAPADEDDKKILYENKLLGIPRIRQVKVRNDSCVVHEYFRRLFLNCYDSYSVKSEDYSSFGNENDTSWRYSKPEETESIAYDGKIATYEGGGFYKDLATSRNESQDIIEELKSGLWITRGTRAIFVDFSIYNANLNLFCICKLVFEFPPTGGILPSSSFRAANLLNYVNSWDFVVFICQCISWSFTIFYLLEEIREIIYFKWRYLLFFWSYIDLAIITMASSSAVTYVLVHLDVETAINKIKDNQDKYGNLEYYGWMKMLHSNLAAVTLFFVYVKIFKYFNINKTMGQLNNTLKRCAMDILGFSIMFFIIFFAYAELGYLLFGSQVEDFSSFGVAMFTLLRTILGDFEYNAIEEANRILAPLYFLSYIFFVFFVLLNMFLAIINDTYADVKTEIAIAPDEMQMTEFVRKKFNECLKKCGFKMKQTDKSRGEFNVTVMQIKEALKKCGFSDLEIEMFFARYNIDPLAEVGDYDINKLMAELEGQPSTAQGRVDDESPIVQLSDFIAQQERLEQIEITIQKLMLKVDDLLKKLNNLDNVRKTRV